jgi:hypothetical protein
VGVFVTAAAGGVDVSISVVLRGRRRGRPCSEKTIDNASYDFLVGDGLAVLAYNINSEFL